MHDMDSSSETSSSIYQPVEPGEGFRILVLQPAQASNDDLICNLIHAQLSDHPQYEALSYVWESHQTQDL